MVDQSAAPAAAAPRPAASRSADPYLVGVVAFTVLAGVLRALLVRDSLWADQLFMYQRIHGHGLGAALSIVHDAESTPPLYFVVAWLAAKLGNDHIWIRIPALVISTATVPLLYALGARTVGRRAGLVAAGLFAIVPFDLFYGTEGRGYSTVVFLSAASTLCLLALVRTGRRRWIAALAVTTAAAAYTHYTVIFVLAAELVWALWYFRSRARAVLVAYGAAVLLYVPWIPSLLKQLHSNSTEVIGSVSGPGAMASQIARVWVGHPFVSLKVMPGRAGLVLIAVGLVVGAAAVLLRRTRPSPTTVLIVLLAAASPVAVVLYELGPNSLHESRYMSASLPAGLLVIGALVTAPRRRSLVALAVLAVVGGVAIGTVRDLGPRGRRPDYRAAAQLLDRIAPPAAPVAELSLFGGPPGRALGVYFTRPHEYFGAGRPLNGMFAMGRRAGRLYLVTQEDGEASWMALLQMRQHGFRLVGRRVWPGITGLVLRTYVPA